MMNSDLTAFRSASGKFGFKNKNGEVIIHPVYDHVENFSDGLAAVNIGCDGGFVQHGNFTILNTGKWGFVNEIGEVVIDPVYDRVEVFSEGLAAVNIGYQGGFDHYGNAFITVNSGKWGFINKKGEVVIPLDHHSVKSFSEGLALVDNSFYIDTTGKAAITLAKYYDEIYPFAGDFALVARNKQYGYIDRSGKEVVPSVHPKSTIDHTPIDQLIRESVLTLSPFESSGKWGYKNNKGEIVIAAIHTIACGFSDDLALVERDGQWFYIHRDGSQATPFLTYDHTENFVNGYARVRSGKLWGYIDKTGKEVVPVKYDFGVLSVTPVEKLIPLTRTQQETTGVVNPGKLTPFQSAGMWGYINEQSEIVIQPKYESVSEFSEGLAKVKRNTRWGFIDSNDQEVIPCSYDDAHDFCEGVAIVKRNKTDLFGRVTWGFVDKTGKEIMLPKYWTVNDFSGGVAIVGKGKYGYVDKTGEEVVPVIYDLTTLQSMPLKELLSKHRIQKEKGQSFDPDNAAR